VGREREWERGRKGGKKRERRSEIGRKREGKGVNEREKIYASECCRVIL
jgi:hypothetical protein